MIKKTIVILLTLVLSMPVLPCNATVNNEPEPNSTKVENTKIEINVLSNLEQQVQEKKKQNEELIRLDKERKRIETILNENTRKNNVHVYEADVTSISNITANELSQVFYKLGKDRMAQYSQAFVDAERKYGINALFLAAVAAHESGWGSKAGGENGTNLTGYCVYNNESIGYTFNSGYEGILETARLLKADYLTPGSKHYYGTSVEDINTDYCLYQDMKTTDYRWTGSITSIENKFENVYQHEVKTLEKAL